MENVSTPWKSRLAMYTSMICAMMTGTASVVAEVTSIATSASHTRRLSSPMSGTRRRHAVKSTLLSFSLWMSVFVSEYFIVLFVLACTLL